MRLFLTVVAVLCASPALAAGQRQARLLEGETLDGTYRLSQSSVLQLTDGLRFDLADTPAPLDDGGGVSSSNRPIVALLLGLILGFGTGHLVAGDRDSFILFLIVDVAILVVSAIISATTRIGWFWGIGGLGLLISHIFQGIDAYQKAGGARLVQWTRERTIRVSALAPHLQEPVLTTRAWALAF